MSPKNWTIRFGQIFHRQLLLERALGPRPPQLENFLLDTATHPPAEAGKQTDSPFSQFQINPAKPLFRKNYAEKELPPNPPLDLAFAADFPFTIILIPTPMHQEFSHTHPFEDFFPLDQFGLDIRFASYSAGPKETPSQMASAVAELIQTWENIKENILLVSHHFGSRLMLDLMGSEHFSSLAPRVKGFFSLSGSLSDPLIEGLDRNQLASVTDFFNHFSLSTSKTIDAKTVAFMRRILSDHADWGESLQILLSILEKDVESRVKLPDLTAEFFSGNKTWKGHVLAPHTPIFTIASIFPYSDLWKNPKLIVSPDQLLSVILAKNLSDKIPGPNNGCVPLEWQHLSPLNSRAYPLATFHCDFFGLTYGPFLSRSQINPFPRRVLFESLVIFAKEFYSSL